MTVSKDGEELVKSNSIGSLLEIQGGIWGFYLSTTWNWWNHFEYMIMYIFSYEIGLEWTWNSQRECISQIIRNY